MEVVVQVQAQGPSLPRFRRVFNFPAVPMRGDRVLVDEFGAGGGHLEGEPPLLILLGVVPNGGRLAERWTEVSDNQ